MFRLCNYNLLCSAALCQLPKRFHICFRRTLLFPKGTLYAKGTKTDQLIPHIREPGQQPAYLLHRFFIRKVSGNDHRAHLIKLSDTGTYSSSILYGRTLCRFRDGDAQGNKDRQTGDPCGTGTAVSENFIRAVGDRFAFWKEHSIIKERTKEKGV